MEDQDRRAQCGTKKFCMVLEKIYVEIYHRYISYVNHSHLFKMGMKVGDFMSAKYHYVLAFWIGMFTPTREFLQVLENRYLYSHVPCVPRVRRGFGVFLFPVTGNPS